LTLGGPFLEQAGVYLVFLKTYLFKVMENWGRRLKKPACRQAGLEPT
jgi:hypothetical protein